MSILTYVKKFSSSWVCLRRRSRSHEFPPSRSVLSASLRSGQSKIHRLQVGLHSSEPGLPWTTNPPSPVVRWARSAGLESSVMILSGVDSVEMSNEGQTTAADCPVRERISSLVTNSDQCMFRICLRHQLSSASIVLDKITVTDHVSAPYKNIGRMHVL